MGTRKTIALAIATAAMLSGCSGNPGTPITTGTGVPSTPAAQSSSQPSTDASQHGLRGLAACELLTEAEVKRLGATNSGRDAGAAGGAGTSGCDWTKSSVGGEGGYVFGLTIRPEQGIDDVNVDPGWTKRTARFAGHDAVVISEQREASASCTMAVEVGPTSRMDFSANGGDTVKEMCDLVADVATIVEPKFPREG